MSQTLRLNKYIASCGHLSRRAADKLIAERRVTLNGQVVDKLATQVDPSKDRVTVDGGLLQYSTQKLYYALHKPVGYTSTLKDAHAKQTIASLIPQNLGLFNIGRLDRDSRGLLLITNDGDLAYKLAHPKFMHEKEYIVEVVARADRNLSIARCLKVFSEGILLDDVRTAPAQIEITEQLSRHHYILNIVLHEGRNRQIRRMFESLGWHVKDLLRVRIGKTKLGELESGACQQIDYEDII